MDNEFFYVLKLETISDVIKLMERVNVDNINILYDDKKILNIKITKE